VKNLAAVGLGVLFAACSLAQHSGFSAPQSHGSAPAYGPVAPRATVQVAPRATVQAPSARATGTPYSITDTRFASRLGSTVSGLGDGRLGDGRGYHRFRRTVLVPYAYPVYVGGYGYNGYADPAYGGYYAPEQQPDVPPQTVMNQSYIPEHATPVMRDYTQDFSGVQVYQAPGREPVESAEDDTANSYYLLAFKDHSIYSAFAYWVEGDTLHYVTPQRVHNQASLSLVDRELTERLNRDRSMQVKLPK
jgi:hypothetical protein